MLPVGATRQLRPGWTKQRFRAIVFHPINMIPRPFPGLMIDPANRHGGR
jgi:hypothetical protein